MQNTRHGFVEARNVTVRAKRIRDLAGVKRIIGGKLGKVHECRNLTPAEVAEVGDCMVERDTECNWFARHGGCGWSTLLVVVE